MALMSASPVAVLVLLVSASLCAELVVSEPDGDQCAVRKDPGKPSRYLETAYIVLLCIVILFMIFFFLNLERLATFIAFGKYEHDTVKSFRSTVGTGPIEISDTVPVIPSPLVTWISSYSQSNFGDVTYCELDSETGKHDCLLRAFNGIDEGEMDRMAALFCKETRVLAASNHENILKFYGMVNPTAESGLHFPAQVLEYPKLGRLDIFLRESEMSTRAALPTEDRPGIMTQQTLVRFAHDICSAVEYIHQTDFVHKDLGCRNCFVTNQFQVKLSMYELHIKKLNWEYRKPKGFLRFNCAYRWMSPEMVSGQDKITCKSDIYMMAVTMWEIFQKGEKPYPSLKEQEAEAKIAEGKLLPWPKYCSSDVHEFMNRCWLRSPNQRPTATEAKDFLKSKLPASSIGLPGCDIDDTVDYLAQRRASTESSGSTQSAQAVVSDAVDNVLTVHSAFGERYSGQPDQAEAQELLAADSTPSPTPAGGAGDGDTEMEVVVREGSGSAVDNASRRSDAHLLPGSPSGTNPHSQTTAV
ncbi:BDNF/NT-3 growth factors receptor-like [Sycon ciliatum]|uniref:BDNF/NT-3 growth factors receptor-like n=1 Tax=Sycon ciliatum TaxID=27933 RepID=UPI0031F6305B